MYKKQPKKKMQKNCISTYKIKYALNMKSLNILIIKR